jgi:hypothetical protein
MADWDVGMDWDGVLVDEESQEWLDGALEFLHRLKRRGFKVIVHTCRANWPEGLAAVKSKLAEAQLDLPVWDQPGKPYCRVYVDDHAYHFSGDWSQPLKLADSAKVRRPQMAPTIRTRKAKRPRPAPGWR